MCSLGIYSLINRITAAKKSSPRKKCFLVKTRPCRAGRFPKENNIDATLHFIAQQIETWRSDAGLGHLATLEAANLILFGHADPFVCLSPAALAPAVLPSAALVPGSRKAPGCCTRASPACCPPTCCHTLVREEHSFICRVFSTPRPSATTLNYFQPGQGYNLNIDTW